MKRVCVYTHAHDVYNLCEMHVIAWLQRHTAHSLVTLVLHTTIQDQVARFAFDLVYTSHMVQVIQALQSHASLGSCVCIKPSGMKRV